MSILTWIEDKKRLKLLNAPKYVNRSADSSKGLWTRCDKCGVILYIKHLKENGRVCFGCSYHLQMMSRERIENLLDRVPAIFSSNPTSSENSQKGARSAKRQESFCKSARPIFSANQGFAKQSTCTYVQESAFSQKNPESRTRFNSRDSTVSSWRPLDETLSPCDPLTFHDQKRYRDRLKDAQERTGLQDAIQTGTGMIDGIPVALAVMDFSFMGGSMGSVVGEKITRLIEYATGEGLTLLIVSASGGARMQEGVFSLMQMAKISSALQIYQSCARLLYISILTSPTTGGVTASFAMLGDIIFAEPKALIAFAGRRVIEQTLAEDLPEDFQTSESMLHHGLVDLIVPRRFLRQAISETIRLYQNAPFKKIGVIPFGVQNPITFLTEEKVRRQWSTLTLKATKKHAIESKSLAKQVGFLSGGLARQSKAIGHHQEEMAKSSSRVVNPAPANLRSSAGLQAGTRHGAYREILTSFEMMLNLFQYGKVVKSNPTQMKTGEKPSFVSNGEGDNPLASANQTLSFVPGGESTLPREGGVSQGSLNLAEGKTKKKWGRDSLQNNCTPKGCKSCANLLAFSPYGGVRSATAENRFLQKPVKTAKWTDLLALSPIVLLRSPPWRKARGCANRMCKSSVQIEDLQSKAKQSTAKQEPGNMLSFKTLAFRNHGSFKAIDFRKICLFKAIPFKKRGNVRNHSYPEHKSERSSISRINGKGVSLHRIGLKKNLALPIMLRANLKRFGETGREIGNRASHDLGLANPVHCKSKICTFCANLLCKSQICKAKQTSADPLARKDNRNGDHSVPYYPSLQPKGSVHNLARDLRRAPQPHHETGSILRSNGSTKAFCPKGKKERLFSRNMGGQKDFCSICKSNLQRLVYSYRTTQQRVAQKGHARQRGKKVGACKGRARTCNTCYQSFFPAWPRNEIDRFDLLHHFRSFSEGFRSNALLSSQSNKERNRFSRASKDARGPEIVDLATGNADIDFLNQAIELAATDSVEWRAFYIHQQLSENMGFLEDFLQQDYDSRERNGNLFFYKSICRTQKALNE